MKDDSARDKAMDKLVSTQLRARLKPGSESCPNAEILAAYVERTLSSRERASCESHLAGCLGCQALVAELVRLSEDDEPVGIQTAAAPSARAATAPRFRWAWAGSALAAVLVVGLWYTGEFQNILQQTPEINRQIQVAPANKPPTPSLAATENDSKVSSPPTPESRGTPGGQPAEKKALDAEALAATSARKTEGHRGESSTVGGLGGIPAHRATAAQNEYAVTNSTSQPAPPAPASDHLPPARAGAIATMSQRAALAKDERGQSVGNGGGVGQGVAGGIVSGTTTNNPSANRSTDDLSMAGRNARVISPSSAPKTANEEANSKKSDLQDEAKTKERAPGSTAQSTDLSENQRDKQQVPHSATQTVIVTAAAQSLEVQAESSTPQWRVGRRGLIQKRDANGKWMKLESGVKAHLDDIAFSSPDAGWAVGHTGTILRTMDGGATWNKLPSPTPEDLVRVTATSDQSASVVTRGGQTFTTTDGGESWSSKR